MICYRCISIIPMLSTFFHGVPQKFGGQLVVALLAYKNILLFVFINNN